MTLDELVMKLKSLSDDGPEEANEEADRLLLEYIDDERVTEAFKRAVAWYDA